MKINTLTNQFYINNNRQNFGAKKDNKTDYNKKQNSEPHRCDKSVPAMMALAGLLTLNGCTKAYRNFSEMKSFKNECYENIECTEDNLSKIDEKTFILSQEKDSVFKETDEYKYSHIRFKDLAGTKIFAKIHRKSDNKNLEVINVYDKDNNLTDCTLKDPETKETYYLNYDNGHITDVHDKNGKPLDEDNTESLIGMLLIACAAGGINLFSRKNNP